MHWLFMVSIKLSSKTISIKAAILLVITNPIEQLQYKEHSKLRVLKYDKKPSCVCFSKVYIRHGGSTRRIVC